MRVAFAGTPAFAVPALERLHAAGHAIILVLTQPDRPAGRGLKLTPSAVGAAADQLGLPVDKPLTLRDPAAQRRLSEALPDVLVVAAYGLILPPAVLAIPPRGCLNIHASLLPRWRGAAPVHRAILAGDAETGVDIMSMDAGLDTGAVLLERRTPIDPTETTGELTRRLANLGAEAIVEALERLPELVPQPQPTEGVTYAAKVSKSEALVDWSASAAAIARQVRAFNPSPGAEVVLAGERVKVWDAVSCEGAGEPGAILDARGEGVVVACGEGALRIRQLQRPGGKRLMANDFLRGRALAPDPNP